jgi:tetratricopeptide (TPR) repeat protein
LWEGDPIAAERELRPGYEALRRIGEENAFSALAAGLAQAVYAQGRYDEAEKLAQESREASRLIDIQSATAWRTVKAKVLARRGEAEAARELVGEAIAFVEHSDFLPARAEALTDLAEILLLVGRPDEAPAVLEEALRLDLKENAVSAVRTRSRLEELLA